MEVALSSIRKVHLKKVANQIQDFLSELANSEFIQWYLISMDIIESKLYTEKPASRKKSIPNINAV